MKKQLLAVSVLLLLCHTFSFAGAPTARVYSYNSNKTAYLAEKLAKNQPITYCVYISKAGEQIINKQDFQTAVKALFKLWTAYPALQIRAAGRAEEFAPVLQALEKEPKLIPLENCDFSKYPAKYQQYLDPKPAPAAYGADISFFLEDSFFAKLEGYEKIGPHYTFRPAPRIVIPTSFYQTRPSGQTLEDEVFAAQFTHLRQRIANTPNADSAAMADLIRSFNIMLKNGGERNLMFALIHEIGHSIGLADQRRNSLDNADILYSTMKPRLSIMDNWTRFLTCDDADGMIMLFDDALGVVREDFASLCDDGIKFSKGMESFTGQKTSYTHNSGAEVTRTFYEHTKDTGVYLMQRSVYVSLESKEESEEILDLFERSQMPKDQGGYQQQRGSMRITDFNNPEEKRVPVGKHITQLTLGLDEMHKQVLTEQYDQDGNLLFYTLEIYNEDHHLVSKKTVHPKK